MTTEIVQKDRSDKLESARVAIRAVWQRGKPDVLRRIGLLEEAAVAAHRGDLQEEWRRAAVREAHKLAGSLGTFGFPGGSTIARSIEELLQLPERDHDGRLTTLVAALKQEVGEGDDERGGGGTGVRTRAGRDPAARARSEKSDGPLLVVVSEQAALAERLAREGDARGVRSTICPDVASARRAIGSRRPDVVLLDLASTPEAEGSELLRQLSEELSVPVMVLTSSDSLVDRVEIARFGGRGFLHSSLPPGLVMDAVTQLLERMRGTRGKVLAVDDDPVLLGALQALLEPQGIELSTLAQPLAFWDHLEEESPDLIVLDVDMPNVSGLELCGIIRNDQRWASLPVLFLTARTDVRTVKSLFEAGADDYVMKPIVGPELVTRIANRLERARLFRSMAETDTLTGVANRRKSGQVLAQYLRLSERYGQPLSMAIIDIDHFKKVNDDHGHAVGDAVLRELGHILLQTFRGEDIVARWGGEEFVVGMYGMTRENGVRRLSELLDHFRGETFEGVNGNRFTITFSAGVAEAPSDGSDLQALYRAGDNALYRAKEAGRARVLPAQD